MTDDLSSFSKFSEAFKKFDETKSYKELEKSLIMFDSSIVELQSIDDVDSIISEMNKISRRMFTYGMILESQSQVLQKVEEEFELWKSQKLVVLPKSQFSSEKSKDDYIKSTYVTEYSEFLSNIREEKYKVGLLKRAVNALDSFSYKLHSILSYKQKILDKTF